MDVILSSKPKNMLEFIEKFKTEKGFEFTHTSLAEPTVSFYVTKESLDLFYKLYEAALKRGDNIHITEKNRHIGPLIIDLDFRFPLPEAGGPGDALERAYDTRTIKRILRVYVEVIQKYLKVKPDMKIYVMEKPGPVNFRNHVIKDGLHIVVPEVVTKASVKHLIRSEVLAKLEPIMKEIGCVNTIEDIVDQAVIEKNNWFMFGSKKVNSPTYEVTSIYTFGGDRVDLLAPEEVTNYVRILSIRNKYDETHVVKDQLSTVLAFEDKEEEVRRNTHLTNRIISKEVNKSVRFYENIDQVFELVNILDSKRAEAYDDWIRMGWCLRNIDNRLLTAWEEFSTRSRKYTNGECGKQWACMREGGLGIGTLHLWAKKDNPEAYAELMKNDLRTLLYQSMSMTHNDIARVVYHLYQHEFVCASIKHRSWFEFRNHRWHVSDSGLGLRIHISEDVWKIYNLESIEYSQKGIAATNKADQDKFIEQAKKLSEISMKLRNSSFKENIMKECSELFYVEKFEDKLDSNTHLIAFENGVYDIEMHQFRDGRPEDYITFTTGNNYIPYDPTHPMIDEINCYLEQVLTKKDVREYVLKLFGMFITGQIKEQKFYIWTGSGCNSKSKLIELFEKSFGDYCCKFPITLLTQKRVASNAANSELARAKGKRFACLQEPSEDEKINIGLMKELSGGDKIMARALFKEPFEFFPQFKMLLLCNHLPAVPSDDGGTWRRIRVVKFTSKFCENPVEENEFPIDYDLSDRIERWKEYFMGLVVHYLKKYQLEGMSEPADVLDCTSEYKCKNDHMSAFVAEHVERKEGAFMTVEELFSDFKDWVKNDNIPVKIRTKTDLEAEVTKRLPNTKCVTFHHKKGWRGWRMVPMGGSGETDVFDNKAGGDE